MPSREPRRHDGAAVGQAAYADARSVFTKLNIPRRIAQLDPSLVAVAEIPGATHRYEVSAVEGRLSRRSGTTTGCVPRFVGAVGGGGPETASGLTSSS